MKTKTEFSVTLGDSVNSYTELLELFKDHNPDFLHSLKTDELINLDHAIDFDPYVFLVLNYETIIVLVDDAVVGIYSMDEFTAMTKQMINDEE